MTGGFCRGLATLALALTCFWGTPSAAAPSSVTPGQWPQWRGPQGLGVTADSNLPERWDDGSENIKWKTKIPGVGYSSPVVSQGRVFVTTAYEDSMPGLVRRVSAGFGGLFGATFLVAALVHLRRSLRAKRLASSPGEAISPGRVFNGIVAGVSIGGFFLLLALVFLFPEQYDATVGHLLANVLGTYETEHVFYVHKDVMAATWLNTGAVALLGFAAALYWLRAHSVWRLLGGFVFAALAVAFVALTPFDAWKRLVVLWTRLLFAIPAALVATWHSLNYLALYRVTEGNAAGGGHDKTSPLGSLNDLHISWKYKDMWRVGGVLPFVLFLSMALLAALAFVPTNLILPNRGMHRAVVCLDYETGDILWQTRVFTSPAERKHSENSYATPTPATDGERVIANFGVGVACLDLDGRTVWKTADPMYSGDTRYGAVSSVLLWNDKAIVLQESEQFTDRITWLAAFEKTSGDVLWKVSPVDLQLAYTTGHIYEDAAGPKLIVASFKKLFCFDVESGQLLWEYPIPMVQLVAGIARSGDVICIGGGTWGPAGLFALKLDAPGQDPPVRELWQGAEDTPGCASPVIYNGILFTITDAGTMCAYDVNTGRLHWRKRLSGRYLASLLAGEGRIYASNTAGWTTVIAAEPELRILGRNKLSGDFRASIAVIDSNFLVRTSEFLYRIAP